MVLIFLRDLFLSPMPTMLPAEPANGHERQHQRQHHEKHSRRAFADAALQEYETNH